MKQSINIELLMNIEAETLEEAIQHAMNTILDCHHTHGRQVHDLCGRE